MMKIKKIIKGGAVGLLLAFCPYSFSAEQAPVLTGGEIQINMRDGGQTQIVRYRYTKNQLRIDRPGNLIPSPPVNLIDFEAGTIKILHPHNSSWEEGSLTAKQPQPQPVISEPMVESPSAPPIQPPEGFPKMPDLPQGIGPGASSPQPSTAMPPKVGMMPPSGGGMPAFPMMPEFPRVGNSEEANMELVAQNQTNTLVGLSCQLYTAKVPRMGTLSLWLSDDFHLPPFYRLRDNLHDDFGRKEWDAQLAQLLRDQKLFPIKLELRSESGQILVEWSVQSINTSTQLPKELFKVPPQMIKNPF